MRFVFWENIVSPHRSAFLRALTERGHECALIVDRMASPRRLAMGWRIPEMGRVRVVEAVDEDVMRREMDGSSSETVHVLGGCHFCRTERYARRRCVVEKRRFGMCAEGGVDLTWRRYLRRIMAWGYARRYRSHCDFILAMGNAGVNWYRRAGYPETKIFPYLYTIENVKPGKKNDENVPLTHPSVVSDAPVKWDRAEAFSVNDSGESTDRFPTMRILYVGSFNHRKATDLLMKAILLVAPQIHNTNWRISLIGDGELRPGLERLVTEAKLADRVDFPGFLPSEEVLRRVEQSDLVVIPSRHDGWCAVTNEALQMGTPVVCSDRVGSECVVRNRPELGEVYPCYEVDRLAEILRRRIAAGPASSEQRRRIRDWSVRIQGPAVAEYFEKVMRHVYEDGPRPEPTWEMGPETVSGEARAVDSMEAEGLGGGS